MMNGQSRNICNILPMEILSCICELLCIHHGEVNIWDVERFQLVCKRFRDIALRLPLLWAEIDNSMPMERMEMQLERSGNVPMMLRVVATERAQQFGRICLCSQFAIVAKNGHCWRKLDIVLLRHAYFVNCPLDHDCLAAIQDLDLPSLTELTVDICILMWIDRNSCALQRLNWRMPVLERLVCKSSGGLSLPFTTSLKELMLQTQDRMIHERTLYRFLTSTSAASLTMITFDFSLYPGIEHSEFFEDVPITPLRYVETLTIDLRDLDNEADLFQLLGFFDFPDLKTLLVRIHGGLVEYDDFWTWLGRQRRASLTAVEVTVVALPPDSDQNELWDRVRDSLRFTSSEEDERGYLPEPTLKLTAIFDEDDMN